MSVAAGFAAAGLAGAGFAGAGFVVPDCISSSAVAVTHSTVMSASFGTSYYGGRRNQFTSVERLERLSDRCAREIGSVRRPLVRGQGRKEGRQEMTDVLLCPQCGDRWLLRKGGRRLRIREPHLERRP